MPECLFKIFRYDAAKSGEPRFDTFVVSAREGMTVQQALFEIQERQDPSLSFRYSCRGAICGSCGAVINGKPDLACRVQVSRFAGEDIVIEPLPNLDIIKDLVVDMAPFWEKYESVRPWLITGDASFQRERAQSPRQRAIYDRGVNCILCACCHGACPVLAREGRYVGPAALAKLFRFLGDSRDRRDLHDVSHLNTETGLWGCDSILSCIEACPKDVRPTDGIAAARRRLVTMKFKSVFRHSPIAKERAG
jgi:succinate dehydrogenase / fumarate reductase iron-sulfur subunit